MKLSEGTPSFGLRNSDLVTMGDVHVKQDEVRRHTNINYASFIMLIMVSAYPDFMR